MLWHVERLEFAVAIDPAQRARRRVVPRGRHVYEHTGSGYREVASAKRGRVHFSRQRPGGAQKSPPVGVEGDSPERTPGHVDKVTIAQICGVAASREDVGRRVRLEIVNGD